MIDRVITSNIVLEIPTTNNNNNNNNNKNNNKNKPVIKPLYICAGNCTICIDKPCARF